MTTEIVVSDVITNDEALTRVPNLSLVDRGFQRVSSGVVTVTTGKTSPSVYPMVRIPTNCRVTSIKASWAAGSASSAMSIDAYYNKTSLVEPLVQGSTAYKDGTTAVSGTNPFFASAIAMTSAGSDVEEINQAGNLTPALRQDPLWQMLGLTTDPGGTFDICYVSTATNAAGFAMYLQVSWVA